MELIANLNRHPDFVNLNRLDGLKLDLRYASTNNFLGRSLYGDFNAAFLHNLAAQKLELAVRALQAVKPTWKFVIFDALRPHSVQKYIWEIVKDTPARNYFANPIHASLHSFGFAIDLNLLNENGQEVDMGTHFDFFGIKAEPRHEEDLLRKGELTSQQIDNRLLLRSLMVNAGFEQLMTEWWHFNALPAEDVRQNYSLIE